MGGGFVRAPHPALGGYCIASHEAVVEAQRRRRLAECLAPPLEPLVLKIIYIVLLKLMLAQLMLLWLRLSLLRPAARKKQ